jgi:CheY-like chemotaxis protein
MTQTHGVSGKQILLVDDNQEVRDTLRLMLSEDSHTVVEANNGAEALMLFRRSRFDLVMIDFEMPFVRGDELAAKIRQMTPSQRILMITGFARKVGPQNPVDAILHKPFAPGSLRDVMNKLISQPGENSNSLSDKGKTGTQVIRKKGRSDTEVIPIAKG